MAGHLRVASCVHWCTTIVYVMATIFVRGTFGGPTDSASQQNCYVGHNVTLRCHTNLYADVDWMYKSDPTSTESYVYSNGVIYVPFRPRFTIDRSTEGDYNLVIVDVQLSDAGHYACAEDGGFGTRHPVELIVGGDPNELATTTVMTNSESTRLVITIVVVVVGVIIVVGAVVIIVVLCQRKRKKRKQTSEGPETVPFADKSKSSRGETVVASEYGADDQGENGIDAVEKNTNAVNEPTDGSLTKPGPVLPWTNSKTQPDSKSTSKDSAVELDDKTSNNLGDPPIPSEEHFTDNIKLFQYNGTLNGEHEQKEGVSSIQAGTALAEASKMEEPTPSPPESNPESQPGCKPAAGSVRHQTKQTGTVHNQTMMLKLSRCKTELVKRLNFSEALLEELRSYDIAEIRTSSTQEKRVEALLELLRSGQLMIDDFMKCLNNAGQQELAKHVKDTVEHE